MGFSGHVVFGRAAGPLIDAPVFAALDDKAKSRVDVWWPRPGGWQTLALPHGEWPDEHLSALVTWTGAPVCVADVYDSDMAEVTGLAPGGGEWSAVLNLDIAAALWAEHGGDVEDTALWVGTPAFDEAVRLARVELDGAVPGSAEGALAWAAAAGFPAAATQREVEELLRSREVFVEDLFAGLLDRLGIPPPAAP
ncbi:hypothetical protein ACFY7C_06405 [Streptomyces sp. NPDC012769]|uniref:hypothetical protein n=1 Tax=Streptomyces sp. NPDC012769 TaxID=3364848 RepID=UPI00367BD346